MAIKTPLGKIEITIDGHAIDEDNYAIYVIDIDKTCPNVSARYCIGLHYEPDGRPHEILCHFVDYVPSKKDEIEGGDNLECKRFYNDDCKLSIGAIGLSGYIDGERISPFDYDNEYRKDGVTYNTFDFTKTNSFYFGVSWISPVSDENENQTWYGADPNCYLQDVWNHITGKVGLSED